MQIKIDIDSNEAEELLFALVLRAKQHKNRDCTFALAQKLNVLFQNSFAWDKFDRIKLMAYPIKKVTITRYDLPPKGELC